MPGKSKTAAGEKFDLKNTGPFTPAEAAVRLADAARLLKGFRLWHPQMPQAHEDFGIPALPYPIKKDAIPKGIIVARLFSVRNEAAPPRAAAGLVETFRKAEGVLAHLARISLKIVIHDTNQKNCPRGLHCVELISEPGKDVRLRASSLGNDVAPTEEDIQSIISQLQVSVPEGWAGAGTDTVYVGNSQTRPEATIEKSFPRGEMDKLEMVLKEILAGQRAPHRVGWEVNFEKAFYEEVLDETKRHFYFPRRDLLKAHGLTGEVGELISLVNVAGFPGAEAELQIDATFDGVENAQAFFELAIASQAAGNILERGLLGMFQTEKGVFAQFCYETKRGGKIFLKTLYPRQNGFGWEYAYEKLLRGEKLINPPPA